LDPEATQQKRATGYEKMSRTSSTVPHYRQCQSLKKGEVVEGSGKCEFLHEANRQRIDIGQHGKGGIFWCFVIAFYPGWQVQIDGLPGTICRANGFMRAVYLRPGAHLVQYQYRPRSLFAGFYLALSALIINLIIVFWGARDLGCGRLFCICPMASGPESDNGCKEVGA
jgi:hypothetical protein